MRPQASCFPKRCVERIVGSRKIVLPLLRSVLENACMVRFTSVYLKSLPVLSRPLSARDAIRHDGTFNQTWFWFVGLHSMCIVT